MRRGVLLASLALIACNRSAPPAAASSAAPAGPQPVAPRSTLVSAVRCSECHTDIEAAWKGSAHNLAERSPAFRAMAAHSGTGCETCHAPLKQEADAADPVAAEGVTCQVCHTAPALAAGPGGGLAMHVRDRRMYGPLCDAKDHYFHRMGCSPLHAKAEFCSGCHELSEKRAGGEVPVVSEYSEWKRSPAAARGQSCQACHMPGERAEVAVGAGERDGVPHHGWMGREGELGKNPVELALQVQGGCERLQVTVRLNHRSDGHAFPSGLRSLLLRVRARDGEGRETGHVERSYGRRLVDAHGAEVPFYAAERLDADSRLGPGEHRTEKLTLPPACSGEVEAELVERELPPEVALALNLSPPAERTLAQARAHFGSSAQAKRSGTP